MGWQAVWKVSRATCDALNLRYPIFIYGTITQVYYEELNANILIEKVSNNDSKSQLPDQYDVPLIELFPTKSQENNALNIERTAEGIDSLRFFYKNLWRPWDYEYDSDIIWSKYLEGRIKFYLDLVSKKMSKQVTVYIKNLLEEANYVFKRKELLEEEIESSEIKEKNVLMLTQLHYRLNLLKNDLELFENSDFRHKIESYKLQSKKDGCYSIKRFSLNFQEQSNEVDTFIVVSEQEFKEIARFISNLKLNEKAIVVACHYLSDVFRRSSNVKEVYFSPGIHSLSYNETLFGNCNIFGTLYNCSLTAEDFGTTLLTLNGSFVFENLTFDCSNSNIGLKILEGNTILRNCLLIGNGVSSTQEGIMLLDDASLILENCTLKSLALGIQASKCSNIFLKNVTIENCQAGIHIISDVNISLDTVKFINNEKGILLNGLANGGIVKMIQNRPKDAKFEDLNKQNVLLLDNDHEDELNYEEDSYLISVKSRQRMYSSVYRPTCSYRDCKNKIATTKTYFELPSEHSRRETWIKNSGISEADAAKIILDRRPIFICEEHFDQRQMQYLQDGRKILLNHPNSNPIPWQPESNITGFPYDEQATQMLQIFESNNTEQDLYDYIFARNYAVQSETQAPTNEQLMILNQNYMLQAAQLQQQSQFITNNQTSHQLQQIRTNPTDRPKQQRRPRTLKPRTHFVSEEPEPPKKDVLCFSVKSNELLKDGVKTKTNNVNADPGSLDIEEQIETYYIMNDKNGKPLDINTIKEN
uniref:CSON000921 protein n=1 Tax=Culicoides sonorensis TaxID=179676 RepID=A0A336LQZ3_CULSO